MKTLVAVDLGNYGLFYRQVLNSVPEGATISMDICRGGGGTHESVYQKQTIYFEVCHTHVAFEEDVRVLRLTAGELFYGDSLTNTGSWQRLGVLNQKRKTPKEKAERELFESAAHKARRSWIKAANKKAP
jgi:hypothetical protein